MWATREADPSLRRIERDAVIICAAAAAIALPMGHWQPDGAIGVLGGGALMAISYWAIRGGVDALVRRHAALAGSTTEALDAADTRAPDASRSPARPARGMAWAVTKFILRYALLAAGAYVILIPLHAHPLGVLVGVSAPVAAIAVEAARLVRR